MNALDTLHDQLVDASTRMTERRADDAVTAPPAVRKRARPTRWPRRTAVGIAGTAVLAGAFLTVDLPGQRDSQTGVAAVLPGPAAAMADEISARRGILHVVSGATRTRNGDGPWQPLYDPRLHDEAWVALDGTGWRDRVVDDSGLTSNDGLQRADGSEQVRRRDGTVRTTAAPAGQTPRSRLPRQAWGRFVGGQLTGALHLERVGSEVVNGRRVTVVRDTSVASPRMDYRYAFDERTGALRQVRQRIKTRLGWNEDQTDIAAWSIEPDSPELRRKLTTLDLLTSPTK